MHLTSPPELLQAVSFRAVVAVWAGLSGPPQGAQVALEIHRKLPCLDGSFHSQLLASMRKNTHLPCN